MTKISNQYSLTNVLFADAVNGRVGIGTIVPSKPLEVYGPTLNTAQLKLFGASSTNGKSLYLGGYGNGSYITSGGTFSNGWVADIATTAICGIQFDSQNAESNIVFSTTTTNNAGPNERMRIAGNGNVGIGTSSPTVALDVVGAGKFSGSSTAAGLYLTTDNALQSVQATVSKHTVVGLTFRGSTANVFDFSLYSAGGTALMTNPTGTNNINFNSGQVWFNGGNVGIGTSSPGEQLTLSRASYPTVKLIDTTDSAQGYFQYHTDANEFRLVAQTSHPLIFSTNDTERMRITSGGAVLINTTSPIAGSNTILHVNSIEAGPTFKNLSSGQQGLALWNAGTTGNNYFIEFWTEATITPRGSITFNRVSGVVAYNTTSDYRLKTEIKDFEALSIIKNLKPKEFRINNSQKKSIGFIAHELQEFCPQAVNGVKDEIDDKGNPKYQGVDYSQLTGLLTKAIQEQQLQINELKALLNA